MKSKSKAIIAGMAMFSILLFGMVPAMALTTPLVQSSTQTSTSTSTTTTTTHSTSTQTQTQGVSTLIQLAQTAQSYAQQVLAAAQQAGANVTKGESLISQGTSLLTHAESLASTNSTQAAKDALGAMSDFRQAAQSLQNQVILTIEISNQVHNLASRLQLLQNRSDKLQTTLTGLCSSKNASATVCSDANSNLSQAKADLANAASQLPSVTTEAQVKAVSALLDDASTHLQQVAADINTLANDQQNQKAIAYVDDVLTPSVTQLQKEALKANLTSTELSQIQGQLGQAQTLLNSAVQSFQAGNFSTGLSQVSQAPTLIAQVLHELVQDAHP